MGARSQETWPIEALDVMPDFETPPNFEKRAVTVQSIRFGGGHEGILAPLHHEQRVFLVVDGVVTGIGHMLKTSDKTTAFERAHKIRPSGVYVLRAQPGLDLVNACQQAHAQQFSTHGGELTGLDGV